MSTYPSTTIDSTPTLFSTTIKPSHCSNTTKPDTKTSYNTEKSRLFVEKQKQSSQAWLCGTGTSFYCTRQGDDFGLFEYQKAYHDQALEFIRSDVQTQDTKTPLTNKKTFETAVRAAAGRYNANHRWAKAEIGSVFYDCSPSAQLFVADFIPASIWRAERSVCEKFEELKVWTEGMKSDFSWTTSNGRAGTEKEELSTDRSPLISKSWQAGERGDTGDRDVGDE